MTFYRFACSAVIAVAVLGGCRREEARVEAPAAPAASEQTTDAQATSTASAATPDASRTAGEAVDDASITARVKAALLAAEDVRALAIDVDTMQGTVRLTGNVQDATQAQRAEQIASTAEGVRRVENQLTVKPAS